MAQATAADVVSTSTDDFNAEADVDAAFAVVRPDLICLVESLRNSLTPASFMHFELTLFLLLRELGRVLVEQVCNFLEGDETRLPHDVIYRDEGYRRLNKKTPNRHVATLFGTICLWRTPYRFWDRDSKQSCIFPLELQLGLVHGETPALADWIGRSMAETGATQRRVLFQLRTQHGVAMGVKRLRNVVAALAEGLVVHREQAQVEVLLNALQQANSSRGNRKPVLAVGRDGITLRENSHSFFEVATAATVTVFDRAGKRLTTVYLAVTPELGQATMSKSLTRLLTEVLKQWEGPLPTLSYIADSGGNESSYFEDALKKMCHTRTGRRLAWQRVVDYYHAAERIWTMSEKLFGKQSPRHYRWARRMLRLLKKPNGPKRVLHSAATYRARTRMGKRRLKEFQTAYNYIRKRTRWMQYSDYKQRHIPLGSGITEAACKTIYTQRLKLSGMRWSRIGAQYILLLRRILLSTAWRSTHDKHLDTSETLLPQPYPQMTDTTLKNAA